MSKNKKPLVNLTANNGDAKKGAIVKTRKFETSATPSLETVREMAAALGYELRKKGVKREKHVETDADGNPIRNTYMPHLAITATCLARSWKMFDGAKEAFGYAKESPTGLVWENNLLLGCEHIVRFINKKINDAELGKAIRRLVTPLPKSEYLPHSGGKKKSDKKTAKAAKAK